MDYRWAPDQIPRFSCWDPWTDLAFNGRRQVSPNAADDNDYGIEYDNEENKKKRTAVLGLLRRMKADKVPLDALGIQAHIKADSKDGFSKGLRELLDGAKALGLQVYATELDVNDDAVAARPLPNAMPSLRTTIATF